MVKLDLYLVCLLFTSDWTLGVDTDGDHDKNKHDSVEDGDDWKGQDHANPEWPLCCSAAVYMDKDMWSLKLLHVHLLEAPLHQREQTLIC